VTFHLVAAPPYASVMQLCETVGAEDAVLMTLDETNDFHALPVREGEQVVVVLGRPRPEAAWERIGTTAFGPTLSRTEVFHLRSTAGS
jgi:hypothetical protein